MEGKGGPYRSSDTRAGAIGGRIWLQPQLGWEVNEPDELAQVIRKLRRSSSLDTGVSFADLRSSAVSWAWRSKDP